MERSSRDNAASFLWQRNVSSLRHLPDSREILPSRVTLKMALALGSATSSLPPCHLTPTGPASGAPETHLVAFPEVVTFQIAAP